MNQFILKKLFTCFLLLIFGTLVVFSATKNFGSIENISVKVIHVADGDTITILNDQNVQTKICLYGIDAPEKTGFW